jgi:polysaccharide export outer membrane protein
MKKGLTVVLLITFVLSLATPSALYAQESKATDPVIKAQAEVAADSVKKAAGDVPADSDQYIIGPEDVLHVFVWREETLTQTVPVRKDGKISLPLVDDIQAAGLTPLQLKDALTKKLKGFVDSPTVTITIKEANSFKVYVSGEVKQPGVHNIRSEMTLVRLITLVGGFTEWANKRKILIISPGEKGADKRATVNYNKIIDGDEPDVVIKRGDTVIVR